MIKKFQYKQWLIGYGLQPRTIKEYTGFLNNMCDICDRFDQANVDLFISKYKGNVIRSFLRSYQAYLLRNPGALKITQSQTDKIRAIDIRSLKNKKRKDPSSVTLEELQKIYRYLPTRESKLLLKLSFYCALRKSELLSLQYGMFNFPLWLERPEGMGVLTIIGKGNKEGKIPVTAKIMGSVYNYAPDDYKDETPIFPEVNPRTWNRILSRASKQAIGKHVKPHSLRHGAAMYLRGKDFAIDEIKEFLRHEDISTTQIYSRVTPEQLMKKFESL